MQKTKWPRISFLKSPNAWSCLPTAFSMATGIPYDAWIAAIGHDGSKVVFDYLPEPLRRRGFHPQELIKAALSMGIAVTELQVYPTLTTDGKNCFPILYSGGNVRAFRETLRGQRAVLAGTTNKGIGHAVAFDGELELVFDPARTEPAWLFDDVFTPSYALILHRI